MTAILLHLSLLSPMGCAAPEAIFSAVGDTTVPAVQARRADEFVNSIGVNLHISYLSGVYGSAWSTTIKPSLLELGVRHVRDAGSVVDDDAWMQLVYGRMGELATTGVKFNLIMRPKEGTTDYGSMGHLERLLSFAHPVIESFEGLNEHDLSGRPDWVNEVRSFQAALYAAVRRDARTAMLPIYGPSVGRPDHADSIGNLSDYLDYGSIHPYPGGQEPTANLPEHRSRMANLSGTKRLVATETGYHTATQWAGGHPPVSEATMATYVPRLLFHYFTAGIARSYLYELVDEGGDPAEREQCFGLLRADGQPKPAFTALRDLIALLRDPGPEFAPGALGYQITGDSAVVRSALLQKRNGRFYVAIWRDVPVAGQEPESNGLTGNITLAFDRRMSRVIVHLPEAIEPALSLRRTAALTLALGTSLLVVEVIP